MTVGTADRPADDAAGMLTGVGRLLSVLTDATAGGRE